MLMPRVVCDLYLVLLVAYHCNLKLCVQLDRDGTELQMDATGSGPWGRWFERQRLHAHAPEVAPCTTCPFLGTLFELLVSWHSQIVIWEGHEGSCVRCHVDLFESS